MIDADRYRRALGLWATGVTIVTAREGEMVHGMTVSDFAGVSLEPPLVMVCADRQAHTLGVIQRGGNMAINILAKDQRALSNKFASKKDEWTRFEGLLCETARSGAPLIPGAHLNLDCALEAQHEAGDHIIVVGRVLEARIRECEPLLYYAGAYRELAPKAQGS